MRFQTFSILVDDQQRAVEFYTGVLDFVVAADVPLGEFRWLTIVSPDAPGGTQVSLEPKAHPAAATFAAALFADGIPCCVFGVDDVHAEHARLQGAGVRFTQAPTAMGPVITAVLDDTCGNLVQLSQWVG